MPPGNPRAIPLPGPAPDEHPKQLGPHHIAEHLPRQANLAGLAVGGEAGLGEVVECFGQISGVHIPLKKFRDGLLEENPLEQVGHGIPLV